MRSFFALYPLRVLALRAVRGCCRLVGFTTAAYPLRVVLALCLLFALAVSARAATLAGVVIVVIDGDTVLFKPDHTHPAARAFMKVRLADIDAPEHDQPHGEAATQALVALALNQRAKMDVVATDAYGRKVARLTVGTHSVNSELVRRGLAWATTRYRRDPVLLDAQREARRAQRGLWRDTAPTPPWVWRRTSITQTPEAY